MALGRPGEQGTLATCAVRGRRHAAALVPAIDETLRLAGTTLDQVEGLVVADGPGSFTGLRVGWATAQGLVRANETLTVWSVPSLMAAAWTASRFVDGPVAAMYDAFRGEVFAAVYRFESGRVITALPPTVCAPDALSRRTDLGPVAAVGDGAMMNEALVRTWTGRRAVAAHEYPFLAAALIELTAIEDAVAAVPDITSHTPDYGRPAEAQVRWERAHGRALPDTPGSDR